MFDKVGVKVLGIVENMSTHICTQCGHEEAIFGQDGAAKIAEDCQIPLLGQLPLNIDIRKHSDKGVPIVVSDPEHAVSRLYLSITQKLIQQLDLQPKDYSAKFPHIVV